jgi:hypothetical protein
MIKHYCDICGDECPEIFTYIKSTDFTDGKDLCDKCTDKYTVIKKDMDLAITSNREKLAKLFKKDLT